jgi:TM2 domain-containing membrane protein YozV
MRSPVIRPPVAKPGYYGMPITPAPYPPPRYAPSGPAGTAAIPVSAPRTRPVSGTRPVSPIPYPGLPASAPPGPAMAHAAASVHPLTGEPLSDRSSVVAGVLQLLLGWVGAGRLYTGHVAMALAQLGVVWVVAMLTVCGASSPELWALGWLGLTWPTVDGIIMLCGGQRDSEGRRLR